MPPFLLKVTRLGVGGLGAVAPDLAGRLAWRLFRRTPSRRPAGEKARKAFDEGVRTLASAQRVAVPTGSGAVMTYRLSCHDAPRVLIIHGWGSRAEYLAGLASGLRASGLDVTVLDLPGHGRSYGRALDMRLAAEAIAAVEKTLGPFDAAVGHSFGGASLLVAAGGIFPGIEAVRAPRLAVLGAPSQIEFIFEDFFAMVGLPPKAQRRLFGHAERRVGTTLEAFDTVTIARRLGRPLLVIHAEDDKEVHPRHARRYEGLGEHVRLEWANGHGHRRIVSAPEVIAAVAAFAHGDAATEAVAGRHETDMVGR
ncbi:alpha/beta fold hydrolase [Ciceribacter sp. L1K23]|uniref:alpha/beta fold hydrolase n=1 Tax=Ciceribacter sp. L1K23 TaxID=2820276 RepID=UPI001B82093E|nr:alpha/beta fold hydrolase [Ciceribacter sp. L1K23]MBR0555242.1 alpha/beta fold hydrolase [Ciceribacter sp. L1K23]